MLCVVENCCPLVKNEPTDIDCGSRERQCDSSSGVAGERNERDARWKYSRWGFVVRQKRFSKLGSLDRRNHVKATEGTLLDAGCKPAARNRRREQGGLAVEIVLGDTHGDFTIIAIAAEGECGQSDPTST